MIVRFVSSLNHEEEKLFACAILKAATGFLDLLPVAYSIRIETSQNTVYEHSRPADSVSGYVGAELEPFSRNSPTS